MENRMWVFRLSLGFSGEPVNECPIYLNRQEIKQEIEEYKQEVSPIDLDSYPILDMDILKTELFKEGKLRQGWGYELDGMNLNIRQPLEDWIKNFIKLYKRIWDEDVDCPIAMGRYNILKLMKDMRFGDIIFIPRIPDDSKFTIATVKKEYYFQKLNGYIGHGHVILNGNVSEDPIRDAIEYFSYLLSKSVSLDDKIIELYTEKKNIVDELHNKVEKDERIDKLTDELNEYLNQKTSFIELTESEYNELLQAEEKADNSLKAVKGNALFPMSWTLYTLSKFEDAKKCIEELESIASLTGDTAYLLSAIGLGALTLGVTREADKKCDKFIEIYEFNKSVLKDDLTANIIGLVYYHSATCKYRFFKNKLDIAYKHCSYSTKYFGQDLESATDDFSKIIAHLNLGNAYLIPVYLMF